MEEYWVGSCIRKNTFVQLFVFFLFFLKEKNEYIFEQNKTAKKKKEIVKRSDIERDLNYVYG